MARQVEDHSAWRRPELRPLVEELSRVPTRWATLALRVPDSAQRESWRRQVQEQLATALGKPLAPFLAGGEGVLGLQRAFHAAGVQTMVTSLWRVHDAATALLMDEFYRNLWQRKLGPLEALRQAQLMVLEHPERVRQRAEELAAELAARGLSLRPAQLPAGATASGRSHPGFWAGFLLSGQWRRWHDVLRPRP